MSKVKSLFFITILVMLSACSTNANVSVMQKEYKDYSASFNQVWNQVVSDPYEKLPQIEVSSSKLSSSGENIIFEDAIRTLNDTSDILEPFEKLAHPNGVCFKGIWKIDSQNEYGGYFKKGSEALIIVRASSAMSNTQSGYSRAFGFAGKLFPTMNPEKVNTDASANFFLIDDLGGTRAKHYRDVALTNEPSISLSMEVIHNIVYAIKVSNAFKEADTNPTIRQLYQISSLGEKKDANVSTPTWLKIDAVGEKRVDAKDFRDELKIEDGAELVFNVWVASKIVNDEKDWKRIGVITLDTSIVSSSCDRRLHFHHPKWRADLHP